MQCKHVFMALAAILLGLIIFAGCRDKQEQPNAHPKETAAVNSEEVKLPADPFRIVDAAKGSISATSADNLGQLFIPGLVILGVAIGIRLITGSWRDGCIAAGLGLVPAVGAVLLTDFPRVVLLIPVTWVVVLIAWGIRKTAEWRAKSRGFDVVAPVIEVGDTGPKSWGQKAKDAVKDSGMADVVDKALKPLEKLWKE